MMRIDTQKIYLHAPQFMQNLAISYMGRQQFRERYLAPLPSPYNGIMDFDSLPSSQLRDLQNARLKDLIKHASVHVPYYAALFRELQLKPDSIDINNFTNRIPTLEKATIVASPASFHSSAQLSSIKLFTSGTSGSPMPIQCTTTARAINYAYFRKLVKKNGSDVTARSATFAGRILFGPGETQNFWRKDYFNRTLFMSSYHISEDTIPRYIAALERWNPEYIDSYPSAISEIARNIIERRLTHRLKLKFVLTSSETLSEIQKENIENAFNCHIVDHYGCSEMAISAHSLNGRYRIDPLYSLVEFEPASTPGTWSIICTGLLNFGMPLLRYKIGDAVTGVEFNPKSPFTNQTFEAVLGREDDLIITPEGNRIGRLDPAFKGLTGIKQAQIIQTATDQLVVKIASAPDCNRAFITKSLIENLKSRTSSTMNVTVDFVDSIALSRSGKLKSVVSLIKK